MRSRRTPVVLLAAATVLALPQSAQGAQAGSATAGAAWAVHAVVPSATAVRPFVLHVGLAGSVVTMPSSLRAGTYVVHASTTDVSSELQVVRPPSTLTRSRFVALWHDWWLSQSPTTWNRWRTAATFLGGAQVVPRSVPNLNRTPAGLGTFAITLRPGTYWFYTGRSGDPMIATSRGLAPVPASRIRVVTVYGAAPAQTAVAYAGTVRFGSYTVDGQPTSVSLPRSLPAHGYLRGLGVTQFVSTLSLRKLRPGVAQSRLVPGDCYPDSGGAWGGAPDCFEPYRYQLGGGVSAGSAALWWYTVPPGRYAVGQASHDVGWDTDRIPAYRGEVTIVTFS